ncbi:hypothetical protein AbraIFM66951_007241 [Aspergillus brasiliensis]|uniref:CBM-cenC domain-containing protein n=1 Tax=Aspergillus brasiliensis TaxID=319629 RepID=A0A9W5YTP1_9EURO|nr:hypothetical protein AbraCBS73388_007977 [Aspergillus brasiliensis]GKZ44912.1 hypothetical protein AbraIFM66951_007241 [Aspergillus brasiliensis]
MSTGCNILSNPSFETGSLSPWFTTASNVARVTTATPAYAGNHSLDVTTAIDNGPNSFSQTLSSLNRSTTYDFSVQVKPSVSGAELCHIAVYLGLNTTSDTIVTADLEPSERWTAVTGEFTANRSADVLTISAACTSPDNSYTWHVYFDEVVVERSGCSD